MKIKSNARLTPLAIAVAIATTGAACTTRDDAIAFGNILPLTTGSSHKLAEPGTDVGYNLAAVGDLDGDGRDDFVAADYYYGAVYVVYGRDNWKPPTPFSEVVLDAEASNGGNLSVAAAGDVDGDGLGDFLVARTFPCPWPGTGPCDDNNETFVYLVYGSTTRLAGVSPLAANAATIRGPAITPDNRATDGNGLAVASAGDLDGDGHDDFVISTFSSEPGAGRVHVFYGSAERPASARSIADAGAVVQADATATFFGSKSAPAGDVDGDGFDDVLLGQAGSAFAGGAIHVLRGGASRLAGTRAVGDVAYRIGGDVIGVTAGRIGDLDGDGYDDIVVQPARNDGTRFYLFYGRPGGPPPTTEEADAVFFNGEDSFSRYTATAVDDFDGDGQRDLFLGMGDIRGGRGGVYLVAGGTRLAGRVNLDTSATLYVGNRWTPTGCTFDDEIVPCEPAVDVAGAALGAGDFNGDGRGDIVIGAPTGIPNSKLYVLDSAP